MLHSALVYLPPLLRFRFLGAYLGDLLFSSQTRNCGQIADYSRSQRSCRVPAQGSRDRTDDPRTNTANTVCGRSYTVFGVQGIGSEPNRGGRCWCRSGRAEAPRAPLPEHLCMELYADTSVICIVLARPGVGTDQIHPLMKANASGERYQLDSFVSDRHQKRSN